MNSVKKSKRSPVTSAASRTVFDVLAKKEEIIRIEREMADPGFWSDRRKAEGRSQDLALLKKEISRWERVTNDLGILTELAEMAERDSKNSPELEIMYRALERDVREIEIERVFSGSYDRGNAVLSIYSGAGGKDAEDWAALLRRMYERWAERKGFKARALHEHFGELQGPSGWGIKNVALEIKGPFAYGHLKRESGVHRLVRISPFSAKKLRHTSFALVEVMPEFVAPGEVEIRPEDLKTDFFRSSGPGGQNVNKRETAVRITHLPTNIQIAVQVERSQDRNREIALELLRSRLYQEKVKAQEAEARRLRSGARGTDEQGPVSIEWGNQIRSYVLHPYQLVKDHRTGHETGNTEAVLDGDLDGFIQAELQTERTNVLKKT